MIEKIQILGEMLMLIRSRKLACVMLGISAALLFSGCKSTTEKTQEAMSLVQQLDYDAALLLFDEAESAGENERLIARGRGIASMGLTDYEQAIEYFREALSKGSGFVQPVDFDLNYYLAAAYVKNGQFKEAVIPMMPFWVCARENRMLISCGAALFWRFPNMSVPRQTLIRP